MTRASQHTTLLDQLDNVVHLRITTASLSMFARDGSVWTDDTYNFNISDNFDGNDSNKTSSRNYKMTGDKLGAGRSKQTRLAKKHSLNKSTPKKSSRRSTPSEHQVGVKDILFLLSQSKEILPSRPKRSAE